MPVHNPLAAILYSAGSNQVEHVMVAGEWTKFEGNVLMDREKISASLMEQSLDLMDRGKGKMPFTF
jgi:5-methylthioadenosine/S-adenosylhomocysteine deaminase